MTCYCCSGDEFEICCEPFINGTAKPPTAEKLMRSRYAAYAVVDVAYLVRTTHPATRRFCVPGEIEEWARTSTWQKLEILAATRGEKADKKGTVEFKAYYLDEDRQPQIHHENSNFAKELGKWFFVDGRIVGQAA